MVKHSRWKTGGTDVESVNKAVKRQLNALKGRFKVHRRPCDVESRCFSHGSSRSPAPFEGITESMLMARTQTFSLRMNSLQALLGRRLSETGADTTDVFAGLELEREGGHLDPALCGHQLYWIPNLGPTLKA